MADLYEIKVALDEQQEAHVALIVESHLAAVERVERLQAERFAPIRKALGIPEGPTIRINARANGQPAFLSYAVPGAVPVADGLGQVSEKSTSAPAQES